MQDVASIAPISLNAARRAAEPDVLKPLLAHAALTSDSRQRVVGIASGLIADLRAAQNSGWVNQFLQEYRLNSSEGIALLTLAEAFLRVPDPETADMLISDKLGEANWRAHTGKSSSSMVNSATWGLVVGRALVGEGSAGPLRRLIARAGEPFVRQAVGAAMRMMGEVFVMGRTIDEAMKRMKKPENRGFTASFDMLGEAARTQADAERYFRAYSDAIRRVGRSPDSGHSISVKLSALHARYEVAQWDWCVPELTDLLAQLASEAAAQNISLTVDAEEDDRLEMSLAIIGDVARRPELKGWNGMGMVIQAYNKRGRAVVQWADELDRPMNVRLVKGAYWDTEIKRTQVEGLSDYPLFTRKAATDVSYLACARDMLAAKNISPAFASHNALTVATILEWAGDSRDFEFQRLHGMGEGLYERLVREEGYRCRIYAPVGGHRDLLAYLVRRLLENGANTSFVHQLADEDLSDEELLADPAEKIAEVGGTPHPSIPLPVDIFGQWRNSAGIDLTDRQTLADTRAAIDAVAVGNRGTDAVHADPDHASGAGKRAIEAWNTSDSSVHDAVTRAQAAYPAWDAIGVEARARILERYADLIEEHRIELMAICVKEAFKSIPDALGEIREAADFCRYYAMQARRVMTPHILPGPTGERNELRLEGRGTWATIAPWNFPFAIFTGQNAAALVTGNTVVAKPAPQTPLVAKRSVELAHEAGVPEDALILVTGAAEVGAELTSDLRIAGVVFTGSTATAKRIASSLLVDEDRAIIPLIAETGGVNAMIVDSTALPEQVVADVLTSAFRTAGQRCSALRLLILQEEVADQMIEMISGAMDLLTLGDPGDPSTDVGPVIDRDAYERLMSYRETARPRWIKTVDAPDEGLFVPPTMIGLDAIEDLNREWFGPVLHVATWKAGTLAETIERVNAKRFGLTMGLHSRIARSAELAERCARVGNLYINRSMIGAVVGSQPFGGEGLSGTGPKAGGPNYLPRFCGERAISVDTTSAGGNATLLNLDEGAH
ncbi:bifunctional proline dehydrogenase/L-glutamate gamma-semialdehyde dehydrogenase PutA [Sphingomonas sp. AX6]|uniref:bifunctional proline dehydrogenase/L-glutamate gamma-semialdehyde dehydrogenase PutA n=1 Tax=Sphingomonas sp. AX6 TaxID=2653171 RepID=UPI0012EF60D6|nr:bifunctional proline dehydrogenase/L-glutamate gamma-semialdehyde dehydrogenase PutA [Sphingomonas sp. AX6]VXC41883.1 Delta-1-pyrroline-5-carboxylate dehydrogenase,Proline dehydrogenase [Sphingomonas sp. AX6]